MISTLSRTSAVLLIAWILCAPFTISAQTRPTESVESPQAAQSESSVTQPGSTDPAGGTPTTATPSTGGATESVESPQTGQPTTQPTTSTAQPNPTPPATGSTPTTATPGTDSTAESVDQFTSLTQLPGIPEVSNAASLPDFFNNLYRLCIGAAAVIAVLQIMRAGVKFMTKGGSVSANSEAKDMIRNAVIGLILVLSPAIVFGIINPRILNLELNLGGLKPENLDDVNLTGVDVTGDGVIDGYDSADSQKCRAEYTGQQQVPTSPQSCSALGKDYEAVVNSCCDNFRSGHTCCARKKTTDPTIAKTEYWWRVAVKDTRLDTSYESRITPLPPKIEQSPERFTSKEKCLASFNAAMFNSVTLTRKEIAHTYCDCSKPRSEFAECKD